MSDHPEASAIDRVRLDPRLRTRDASGIIGMSIGTLAWAVALIIVIVLPADDGERSTWPAICATGFAFGVVATAFLVWRQRRRR